MRNLRTAVLLGASVVTAASIMMGQATADPPVVPPDNSIVLVGSNTLQGWGTRASADYNATKPANDMYSWDATGNSPIDTKTEPPGQAPCNMARPNGSNVGVTALLAGATVVFGGNTYYCVDEARSSRKYNLATDSGTVFELIGQDAITWAANAGGNAPATLTPVQLRLIYSANVPGCVTWNAVGGVGVAQIKPVLPQSGSGTRSTFLADIGVAVPGNCVTNAAGNLAIEENEGDGCVFWVACPPPPPGVSDPNVIYPYSIGVYICQTILKPAECPDIHGDLTLRQINGINPIVNNIINKNFPLVFIRGLYLASRLICDYNPQTQPDPYLNGVKGAWAANVQPPCKPAKPSGSISLRPFNGTGVVGTDVVGSGWVCQTKAGSGGLNPRGQDDILAEGFLAAGLTCGTHTP